MAVLHGTLMWTQHHKPSDMSGKFETEITRLDRGGVETARELGIEVKQDQLNQKGDATYKGYYVKAKSNKKPKVMDAKKKPLPKDIMIGNGTIANVQVNAYPWNFKGKTGTSLGLQSIQVIDLVEFGGGDNELVEEEGYVVDPYDEDDELQDTDEHVEEAYSDVELED